MSRPSILNLSEFHVPTHTYSSFHLRLRKSHSRVSSSIKYWGGGTSLFIWETSWLWTWFLEYLKICLDLGMSCAFTILKVFPITSLEWRGQWNSATSLPRPGGRKTEDDLQWSHFFPRHSQARVFDSRVPHFWYGDGIWWNGSLSRRYQGNNATFVVHIEWEPTRPAGPIKAMGSELSGMKSPTALPQGFRLKRSTRSKH